MMMVVRRFLSCTRGAAAAEMALIVPLAVLLLFTSLEAGHYFYQQHQVTKALRDGARFAARQSFDDINCRDASAYIDGDLVDLIREVTITGKADGGIRRVPSWNLTDVEVTVSCPTGTSDEEISGIYRTAEPAPQVNIVTNFSYDPLFGGLGVITSSAKLGGRQQAVVMGI